MAQNYIQFTDYGNEKSGLTVTSADLTAANFDAQATASSGLSVAIGALSIGSLTRRTQTMVRLDDADIPTNPFAQRELKWDVLYRGNTSGDPFHIEIPCADLDGNLVPNTDIADLTSTAWANFVTAFEAFARSPQNPTESVTVISAKVVGRNI